MKSVSKRHMRRLFKKERILYSNKLLLCNVAQSEDSNPSVGVSCTNEVDIQMDDIINIPDEQCVDRKSLKEKIGNWYFKNRPSRDCFEELLKILVEENIEVPLSANAFFKKREKLCLRNILHGSYCHFGVKKQLARVSNIISGSNKIMIDVNIDGLPLFKSSRTQLWPILAKIVDFPNISVFPIGIYVGKSKPLDIASFLSDFITELKELTDSGIHINNRVITFEIRGLICDTPAKAFACGIVGHTSSDGCTKCTQISRKIGNVLTYSSTSGELISDADFTSRKYPNHHQIKFRLEQSPFEELGLGMITQVPLDPMHLIDLGVVKKMLVRLNSDKTVFKITKEVKEEISAHLKSLKKYIPREFARYPRELQEICNWKATEFRQFLLYTGILVLKDRVHEDFYYEFLLLHCASRLLSCPRTCKRNVETAQILLELFVENFPVIFGEDSISYNVHSILHISECVKTFGPFQNFSCYPFEDYLQKLKKYVKKPSKILQQIHIRMQNEEMVIEQKKLKINEKNGVIVSVQTPEYFFTAVCPNNFCAIRPFIPIQITGFSLNCSVSILGRRFRSITSFFQEPFNSANVLGTCVVDQTDLGDEEAFNIENIELKFAAFPFDNKYLLVPLLHGCKQ